MYLARIRKWNLFKNLKAHEKEQFAEAELKYLNGAGEAPSRLLHGRLIRRDKVERHLGRQKKAGTELETRGRFNHNSNIPLHFSLKPQAGTLQRIKPARNKALTARCLLLPSPPYQIGNEDGLLLATKAYFDWYFNAVSCSGLTLDVVSRKGLPINDREIGVVGYDEPAQIMVDLTGGAYEIHSGFRKTGWLRIHRGCAGIELLIYRPSPFSLMDILSRLMDRVWLSLMGLRSQIYSFIVSMAKRLLGRQHMWAKILSNLFIDATTDSNRMSMQRYIIDTLTQSRFNGISDYMTHLTEILGYEVMDDLVSEIRLEDIGKELTVSLGRNHIATRKAKFSLAARFYRMERYNEAEAVLFDALPICFEDITEFAMDTTHILMLTYLGYIYYIQTEYEKCVSYAMQALRKWLAMNIQSFHTLGTFERIQRSFIHLARWDDLIRLREEYPDLHDKMPDTLQDVEIPQTALMVPSPCGNYPQTTQPSAV
jgi:tetratricopeptide (TPR) repeat protein